MVGGLYRWLTGACATLVLLTLVSATRADVPISENASRRFNEGVRHLRTREPDRHEKAYGEFKAAYADSPSWKILGNLGIVAQELERDGEAIDAFKGYLEGAGQEIGADEHAQFTSDLELLEAGHASLTLRTTPNGAWIIDERLPDVGSPIVNRYGPVSGPLKLRIRAGHHRVRAELSGHVSDTWEFDANAGSLESHAFELRRSDVPSETPAAANPIPFDGRLESGNPGAGLRIAAYVSLGLGVVGLGAGIGFYVDSLAKEKEADEAHARCNLSLECQSNPQDSRNQERVERAAAERAAQTRSLVGFIGAGAFITTGVILLVLGSGGSDEPQTALAPWIGPRQLGVSGRF